MRDFCCTVLICPSLNTVKSVLFATIFTSLSIKFKKSSINVLSFSFRNYEIVFLFYFIVYFNIAVEKWMIYGISKIYLIVSYSYGISFLFSMFYSVICEYLINYFRSNSKVSVILSIYLKPSRGVLESLLRDYCLSAYR